MCYWDCFGQAWVEPGKEFPRRRKDKCKGPEAGMCSVLELHEEGWYRSVRERVEGEWVEKENGDFLWKASEAVGGRSPRSKGSQPHEGL